MMAVKTAARITVTPMKDEIRLRVRMGITDHPAPTGVTIIMTTIAQDLQCAMNLLSITGQPRMITEHLLHGSGIPIARIGRILKRAQAL